MNMHTTTVLIKFEAPDCESTKSSRAHLVTGLQVAVDVCLPLGGLIQELCDDVPLRCYGDDFVGNLGEVAQVPSPKGAPQVLPGVAGVGQGPDLCRGRGDPCEQIAVRKQVRY
jgi:hypothetical protein